jgi:hypothetical protein
MVHLLMTGLPFLVALSISAAEASLSRETVRGGNVHELPVSGVATPLSDRVDESKLDPFTLRVIANTARADAERLRKALAHLFTHAKQNQSKGAIRALETTADYLEGRAALIEIERRRMHGDAPAPSAPAEAAVAGASDGGPA